MAEPYVAQIKLFAGNFAPRGYALCQGQILSIAQNTALFSLLGTQYGGNGTTTFALPDFRGRCANGQGQGPGLQPYTVGEISGTPSVTLLLSEIPNHTHPISGAVVGASNPTNTPGATSMFTNSAPNQLYAITNASLLPLAPQSISTLGGSQPHTNQQPYLCLNFLIALQGVFPPRN